MKCIFRIILVFACIFFYSEKSFTQYEEKIFLQTDRDIYIAGEEVLVNTFCFSPNSTVFHSKVLYVEIFNKEKNIVVQKKLEIVDGVAAGSLFLPKSIKTDAYFVRAYTHYLKNLNPTFFPTRKITCINPLLPPSIDNSKPLSEISHANKNANIVIKETRKHFTIEIDPEIKYLDYKLQVYSEDFQKVKETLLSPSYKVDLSKSTLPFGIIYITLISTSDKILSVRPFYNWPEISDGVNYEVDRLVYKPREKVELNISNRELFNYLSIIVVNEGALKEPTRIPVDILNNIDLLKSYLKENHSLVEHQKDTIDFYLKKEGIRICKTKSFEKLIRLVNDDYKIINQPEIIGLSLKGSLHDENNQPIANERVFLSVFEGNKQFHSTFTDNRGQFYFSLYPKTYLTNRLVVRAGLDEYQKNNILIDYDYSNEFLQYTNILMDFDSIDNKKLGELYINQQISAIKSSQKQNENSFDKQFGTPDYLIDLSDYINLPKLEEVFNEIVPHVTIKKKNKIPYLSVYDETKKMHYDNPLLLLDYVPIFNIEEFLKINPISVQSIAVINRDYKLGGLNYNGIINVTTKNNNFSEYAFPEDVVFLDFDGVSFPYNFENIEYLDIKSNRSRTPDFRNVLYWNPNIKSDTVSFFTSDHCSDYEIIITGIDKQGNIVKLLQKISVEQ